MGAFKAIGLSPSISAIDASIDNTFSWTAQGGVQTKYQIYIYNNTSDVLVYDSTELTSANQYHIVPAASLTNGVDYKWYVATTTVLGEEDSEYEFFTTAKTPVLTFAYPDFTEQYCDRIESFDDYSEWISTGANNCTISENTVTYNKYYGDQSIKALSGSDTGTFEITKTVSLNLNEFSNGRTSNNNDYIKLVVLDPADEISTITMKVSSTSGYFYKTFTPTESGIYTATKGSFLPSGYPQWNNITSISVGYTLASTSVQSAYFCALELYRTGDGSNTTFNNQDQTFYLTYTQEQSIGIKKYKLKIYDEEQELLQDSGWLYDLLLSDTITGLVNKTTYYIEGIVTTQYDQEDSTGLKEFSIDYSNNILLPAIAAEADDNNGTITVDWANLNSTMVEVAGPTYVSGMFGYGLYLASTSETAVIDVEIPDTFTLTFWGKTEGEFSGDLIAKDASTTYGYDYSVYKFYQNDNGIYTYSSEASLHSWEDISEETWDTMGAVTWLATAQYVVGFINTFMFFGLTSKDFIVKKAGDLIAAIDLEV